MKTYFISGHRNITEKEFKEHYISTIDKILVSGDCRFVIGDYYGADIMAQNYLKEKSANVTVYHMLVAPKNNAGFPLIGGFENDEDRDAAMTSVSNRDIAWVRSGNDISGTAINLRRREQHKRENK